MNSINASKKNLHNDPSSVRNLNLLLGIIYMFI